MNAIDRFVASYHHRFPVNASFAGETDHDHNLPDWSPTGLSRAATEIRNLRADLAGEDGDDIALAESVLDVQEAELASSHFYSRNPALYTGEAVFSVIALLLRGHVPAREHLAALSARLRLIPPFLADACLSLEDPPTAPWVARAIAECDAAQLLLHEGFDAWAVEGELTPPERGQLDNDASGAIAAFATFSEWLSTRPTTDDAPCGADLFGLLLKRGHWLGQSASSLLGEYQRRLTEETERHDAQVADAGGWAAIQDRLAAHHPTAETYLDAFATSWANCRSLAEENDLVTWPHFPIRYTHRPGWARAAAPSLYFLNYRSPPVTNPPTCVDYLVPAVDSDDDLRATNLNVIKSNHVAHHGGIGHHVQNAYGARVTSPIARIAGIDCASRIGMYCAGTLVEGWACYATDLMEEFGYFTKDECIAQQHGRIRQLARGIVDIGLHTDGMTRSAAEQFLADTTGMSALAAAREVTRTTMFPGTGLMYAVGTETVHETRKAWLADDPTRSLKDFHDTYVSFGSIPAALVRQRMTGRVDQ